MSRHPLVNARVDTGDDGRLNFFQDENINIPLRVARLNKVISVEDEIRREFSAPFGEGDFALLKAALLYSEHRCVIIITAHHAIADGRSLTYFIHDLLETLSGKELPELALLPPIEELCSPGAGPVGDIAMPAFTASPVPYAERSLPRLKIHRQRLSRELSNRIREKSKQHNTTVHGALAAAFALAFGKLTLESLWGPNVLIGTEGEQTIGVATINNAIHLIHTSYQPAADFLANAEEIL